jgi:hypothetical protein
LSKAVSEGRSWSPWQAYDGVGLSVRIDWQPDQRWEARIIRLAQAWQTSRTRCFGHTGYGSIGEGQPKPHPLSPPLAIGERPCRSGQGRRRPQNHASIPDPGEARDGRHCRIPLDYLFGRSIRVLDWHGLTEDRRR